MNKLITLAAITLVLVAFWVGAGIASAAAPDLVRNHHGAPSYRIIEAVKS